MKIKLAMLCPVRRKIAPGDEGTEENRIAILAQGLAGLGVDVTLFAVEGSQSPGGFVSIAPRPLEGKPEMDSAVSEAVALAAAFTSIREYDLTHSFFGPAALPYSELLDIPMVATIHGPLSEAQMEMTGRFRKVNFVVEGGSEAGNADSGGKAAPGGIAVIAGGAVEYERIYREILAKRENYRPWGHYENLAEGPDHKIKRITVVPEARLSYQKHRHRAEQWVVISGEAVVTLDGEDIRLSAGDTVFIPKGAAHRMYNPGSVPLVFGEVQMGDYFGEDDIIRLEDDYGRSG